MNPTVFEEAFAFAFERKLSPEQFGHWLTGAPLNLTPPEATKMMDIYRRRISRKAKSPKPTVSAEVPGELLTTPTAGRPSIINRSAVKSFALKVSREKRAGKFNRVSKEFLDSVEANLEALIREIAYGSSSWERVVPDPECDWMINGRTLRCVEEKLNEAVQKIVLAKVHGHPSIGKTLK